MDKDYKASRYDWSKADTEALEGDPAFRCILELRARVEALEATQEPIHSSASAEQQARDLLERMGIESAQDLRAGDLTELANLIAAQSAPAPAGSLVERVATFITPTSQPLNREWARDGICQVAGWLRERGHASAASALEQEAGQ